MKIAVIIPVYNAEKTIRQAVKSIDTTHDVEIICVNDGSTDATHEVLEALQKEVKNMKIIKQANRGAAASRNIALEAMSADIEGFLFLDADDQYLSGSIDKLVHYFNKYEDTDVVIGQMVRGKEGNWRDIPTHEVLKQEARVTLAECPEVLQSIGPSAKLFSAKFKNERFDEDVVYCEEHTFMGRVFLKARDIQLIPDVVLGYNEREDSITAKIADQFLPYLNDARQVRSRMMSILLLDNEKIYYSHRLDNLIVSYLIQNYLLKYPKIDITVIEAITQYIRDMQHTHYSGDALFRVIQAVEQGASHWTKETYKLWRQTLLEVGVGRPKRLLAFEFSVTPKKVRFTSKQRIKKLLKK